MTMPRVTEVRVRLEPVTRDPFVSDLNERGGQPIGSSSSSVSSASSASASRGAAAS